MAALPPPEQSDIRWQQRFDNLKRAHRRLLWALEMQQQDPENDLIRMAVIKAYEFTFELAWNMLRDLLRSQGDGQLWIDMLEERNLMAHTYDDARARQAVRLIQERYLAGLQQLHDLFSAKLEESR